MKLVKIDSITPYSSNAKKHPEEQIKQIADSIREFGFQQPIVVDKDNVIIVGHGRYEAAMLLDLKQVPVVVADNLTPAQVKAYRIADNKLNESFWDNDLLIAELEDLKLEGFDIKLTGFDESFLNQDMEEPGEGPEEKPKRSSLVECPECGAEFKP